MRRMERSMAGAFSDPFFDDPFFNSNQPCLTSRPQHQSPQVQEVESDDEPHTPRVFGGHVEHPDEPTGFPSHFSSAFSTSSGNRPVIIQRSTHTVMRNGVTETKSVFSDSRTGVKETHHSRHLADGRARQIIKKHHNDGHEEVLDSLLNVEQDGVDAFERDWSSQGLRTPSSRQLSHEQGGNRRLLK